MPGIAVPLGTRWRTVDHPIPSVAYSSGNRVSVEIPKGFLYKSIFCRLRGNLIVTVGTTNIDGESPLALIQRLEVVADGRKTLFSATGKQLYRISHALRQKAGERRPPGVGVATNAFSAAFILDFQAMGMRLPSDSYFDPAPFEKIELAITWAPAAVLFSAGTATIDVPNTFLDLLSEETSVGANLIGFDKLVSTSEIPILASNPTLRERVPRTGLLQGILIQTERTTAPATSGVAVDDIVNTVKLISDNNWIHKDAMTFKGLQSRNVIQNQLDGSPPYGPGVNGAASVDGTITGYVWLPVVEEGLMSSAVSVPDLNQMELEFNVVFGAGTQFLRLLYVFFAPKNRAA